MFGGKIASSHIFRKKDLSDTNACDFKHIPSTTKPCTNPSPPQPTHTPCNLTLCLVVKNLNSMTKQKITRLFS